MKKNFNEEVAKLKRINYWSIRERNKVSHLINEKGEDIIAVIRKINHLKETEQYNGIKALEKNRNRLLEEQEALIKLYILINDEIRENGKDILKLRQNTRVIIMHN